MPSSRLATGWDRRVFITTASGSIASAALDATSSSAQTILQSKVRAVAFDAFAILDPRPVFAQVEQLFPSKGKAIADLWRTRQFEYTWLRNSMQDYRDFWHVTEDALRYAATQSGVELRSEDRTKLMSALMRLEPWPDVADTLKRLRKRGLRLALLSNMTPAMMKSSLAVSGLESAFEFQLSTDQVKAFKPDPAAYQMGPEAFQLERKEVVFVAFGAWDAAGAKHFGYPVYWSNRLGSAPEELGAKPDSIWPDLSSLQGFIASL